MWQVDGIGAVLARGLFSSLENAIENTMERTDYSHDDPFDDYIKKKGLNKGSKAKFLTRKLIMLFPSPDFVLGRVGGYQDIRTKLNDSHDTDHLIVPALMTCLSQVHGICEVDKLVMKDMKAKSPLSQHVMVKIGLKVLIGNPNWVFIYRWVIRTKLVEQNDTANSRCWAGPQSAVTPWSMITPSSEFLTTDHCQFWLIGIRMTLTVQIFSCKVMRPEISYLNFAVTEDMFRNQCQAYKRTLEDFIDSHNYKNDIIVHSFDGIII